MINRPFIPWVGGKHDYHIWNKIKARWPDNFNNYFEPFMGAGGSFLHAISAGSRHRRHYYGSDINERLVNTWKTVRLNPEGIIKKLVDCWYEYVADRKSYYEYLKTARNPDPQQNAAEFIFLMHVCFNGLYRVNSKGVFNTPIGTPIKSIPVDRINLKNVGYHIRADNIHISQSDYEQQTNYAEAQDFVYLDPPYDHTDVKYDKKSWDPKKFTDMCKTLDDRGVFVMVSHSHDNGILDSLDGWHITDFQVQCLIANSKIRSPRQELIITNYDTRLGRQATLI